MCLFFQEMIAYVGKLKQWKCNNPDHIDDKYREAEPKPLAYLISAFVDGEWCCYFNFTILSIMLAPDMSR